MIAQQLSAQPALALKATKRVSAARKVAVTTAAAETSRRSAISLAAAGALALFAGNSEAASFRNPAQDSTGGTTRSNNRVSASLASSSSYNMEGTQKGGISSKKRKALMASVKRE